MHSKSGSGDRCWAQRDTSFPLELRYFEAALCGERPNAAAGIARLLDREVLTGRVCILPARLRLLCAFRDWQSLILRLGICLRSLSSRTEKLLQVREFCANCTKSFVFRVKGTVQQLLQAVVVNISRCMKISQRLEARYGLSGAEDGVIEA